MGFHHKTRRSWGRLILKMEISILVRRYIRIEAFIRLALGIGSFSMFSKWFDSYCLNVVRLFMRLTTLHLVSSKITTFAALQIIGSKILFTQYTCTSLWWQLVLNTANLWMQLTLKAAVATHVLGVFTGWFTPSTGLARVFVADYLSEVSQSSKVEWWIYFVLWLGLWEFWPWPWKSNRIQYKGARLPTWINFNPSMDK